MLLILLAIELKCRKKHFNFSKKQKNTARFYKDSLICRDKPIVNLLLLPPLVTSVVPWKSLHISNLDTNSLKLYSDIIYEDS